MFSTIPADQAVDHLSDVSGLIAADGTRRPDPALDRWVSDITAADLRGLYRDMVLLRRTDAEGFALQRQGQLALWAPSLGQEAAQIGTARGLHSQDFVFPTYRDIGVVQVRGANPTEIMSTWRGEQNSTYDPFAIGAATMQIIIGAQTLHAVGYAMGIQRDGEDDAVAVAYFGDGATSQGDVNEAMIFAASFAAPVVFVCQNNQWAISEPVSVQAPVPIAARAPGFGIASVRVDGNDGLACLAAMRWARDHARQGRPAFIEAVTYRMGPHTTSDDPTRYRDDSQLQTWRERDPLERIERHLRAIGEWDDAWGSELASEADALAAELRAICLSLPPRAPMEIFDHVYAEPHSGLEREARAYRAYLDGFAGEAAAS